MAASGSQTIQLYYSTTSGTAPVAGNLASGEIALNITDGKLYYKDNSGTVQVLATKAATSGSFSDITISGSETITSGTANGVAYLNGSKVLTTGSALTFDGSGLAVGDTSAGGYSVMLGNGSSNRGRIYIKGATGGNYPEINLDDSMNTSGRRWQVYSTSGALVFGDTTSGEQMRLTSTGLGIGTSSPGQKLDVNGIIQLGSGSDATSVLQSKGSSNASLTLSTGGGSSAVIAFNTGSSNTERMRLDASGNLGLGVTPSAWYAGGNVYRGLQVGFGGVVYARGTTNQTGLASNFYVNTSGTDSRINAGYASKYEQLDGAHSWFTAASSTAGNAITFTQAMTLDASGNLGVGTTTIDAKLNVAGTVGVGTTTAKIRRNQVSGSTGLVIQGNANDTVSDTNPGAYINIGGGPLTDGYEGNINIVAYGATTDSNRNQIIFSNRSGANTVTERARIDSSGNLLVGQTSAGLQNSNSFAVNTSLAGSNGSTTTNHVSGSASGNYYAIFGYSGSVIGSITQSGTTAVLYNVTSDQRLKENIQDADSASALIDSLQVRKYDWKADGTHQRYGFVAQELVIVAPEAVHQPVDPEEMMAVDYSKLVPMLVKEIQSLRARVAQLEGK